MPGKCEEAFFGEVHTLETGCFILNTSNGLYVLWKGRGWFLRVCFFRKVMEKGKVMIEGIHCLQHLVYVVYAIG